MAALAAAANEDLGKLILRLTVGILLLFHAFAFLTGDMGIPNRMVAWGLPVQLAWLGFAAEFFGSLMMIFGTYGRLGGLLVGLFMVAAIILSHMGFAGSQNHLFMVANNPAGNHWDHYFLETQLFYLLGGFTVFFLGAGKYGLNSGGKWN